MANDIDRLATALREAIEIIAMWHGPVAWDIYREHSPEMKRLNEALAAHQAQDGDAKDAARLDWLDAHPRLSEIVIDGRSETCYFYGVAGARGLRLREVIDAAMASDAAAPPQQEAQS